MSANRWKKGSVSPQALRGEGVLEVGRVEGTAFLFVRTSVKLHMFHASQLPDRALDDYAISLAVNWLEDGHSAFWVASNFDVTPGHLLGELERVGYQRISVQDGRARAGADRRVIRAKRKRAKRLKGGRMVRKGNTIYRFRSTHA